MIEIAAHHGSRDILDWLFSEADDSPSEIAAYKQLGEILVATDNDQILGHVQMVETPERGIFEIKSIAVLEERRSGGIGSALLTAAIARCRDNGACLLRLATAAASTDALKFYQRHGFRIRAVIRDFYVAERGYAPAEYNGIPLRDEVILDLEV